jgi:hypothetical protein
MQPPYFVRHKLTCRRCEARQVRWSGSAVEVINLLFVLTRIEPFNTNPVCQKCFHDVRSGEPAPDLPWVTAYSHVFHVFVGAGLGMLVTAVLIVARPTFWDAPTVLRAAPIVLGAVGGLLLGRWQMRQRRPF